MASKFGGVAVEEKTSGGSRFGGVPIEAPQDGVVSDFIANSPIGAVQGMAEAIRNPSAMVKSALSENERLAQEAKSAFGSGDYATSARKGANFLLNAMPGLGSALDAASDDFAAGDYARGTAKTLGLASNMLVGKYGPNVMDKVTSPATPKPPKPPSKPVNVGSLMDMAKTGKDILQVLKSPNPLTKLSALGRLFEKFASEVTPIEAPPTPTVVEAPPVASGTPVRPPLRGKQFGTFNDPTAPPLPAGVTPSGPVRPPLQGRQFGTTVAKMMREEVPGKQFGTSSQSRLVPAEAAAAAPAEMPALEQITEWLASRDGQTARRFTDPVVSEAPITKQTLGDIMDRLMKNRKVPAEVPAATVPAEVPPAAVETPQPATPAPSAAGKPVTAATLMEEVAKPDSFQELRDMIKERAGKKVPPFDWTDEAQFQEYQKALVEDSNIYGNNRTTMADRVTRFMKKNGIEPTDSGIVRALNESAEDIAVSPTTGLKRPSFKAADHEVLFDMIKDRLETPTGGKPAASAAAKPAADSAPDGSVRYVRFGKPPKSGFSVNRRDGTAEAGISTHRLIKHNGEWHLDHAGGGYTTRMDTRPTYELAGELVGYGSDGEPLLKNVTSVKPYKGTPLADLPGTDRTTILEGTPRMPMSAISQDVTTGKVKFLQDPHYADGALTDWMTPDDLIDGIQKHWHTKRGQGGAVRAGELISKIRQAVEKVKK